MVSTRRSFEKTGLLVSITAQKIKSTGQETKNKTDCVVCIAEEDIFSKKKDSTRVLLTKCLQLKRLQLLTHRLILWLTLKAKVFRASFMKHNWSIFFLWNGFVVYFD